MKRRKAQEEMVGFVLIVVIVIVVAVIFLGISLRKPSTVGVEKSEELNSFLSSVSRVTTKCESPKGRFIDLERLIVNCYENDLCENNNEQSCAVLEGILKDILGNSTYRVDKNSATQYYNLTIYYGEESANMIPELSKGICKGTKIYNERQFSAIDGEKLYMSLEVCYI